MSSSVDAGRSDTGGASTKRHGARGHGAQGPDADSGKWPWISLVLRLILAAVFLYAGAPKLFHLEQARRAVRAYELFNYDISNIIGTIQPMFEVALGLALLVGFFTRASAIVSAVLLVLFIGGIASAWARGISIDCGCFSKGGAIEAAQTEYPQEIARDIVFLILAGLLAWKPLSRFSVDRALWG